MNILEIDGLGLDVPVDGDRRPIISDVSVTVGQGEAVGLVGESGSGKSMTIRSVLGMLPAGARVSGDVRFSGKSVRDMTASERQAFLARGVGVVFQDPRAHINPMRTVGSFLCEGLVRAQGVPKKDAEKRAIALLKEVGIADAERRMAHHPHQLSGGLLQRVMIASVLAADPQLILADEPTTALDVTTQEEVMAILDEMRRERGMAMVFVTHDLALAGAVCDRIAVMYAGKVMEILPAAALHAEASHPYTQALLAARPELGAIGVPLATVPGRPMAAFEVVSGCPFHTRCPLARDVCRTHDPTLLPTAAGAAACHAVHGWPNPAGADRHD